TPPPAGSSATVAPCDCASTSCASACEPRIGLVPTTATTRSTARAVAERPCAATGGPARAAHATAVTVTHVVRMSARRPFGDAVAGDGRRAGGALQTGARRRARGRVGGANRLRALHRARDAGGVDGPGPLLAERLGAGVRHGAARRA